ncbi:hypothetical protein Lalb_Chr07g0193851 [Lupinus albus]|uniref:Uncharacterized protein n=1 Tax=Lupinus albus TaxID=3870 RepID=A0A6A4QCS4_LUPAL|nr:hypothetical protein Lalb_Chr07g0193851 [Lupinus albus]
MELGKRGFVVFLHLVSFGVLGGVERREVRRREKREDEGEKKMGSWVFSSGNGSGVSAPVKFGSGPLL